MFKVFCQGLVYEVQELEQNIRQLIEMRDSLQQTIKNLSELSGMEEVCFSLVKQRDGLEEKIQKMISILQALDRIQNSYQNFENRICDYGEGTTNWKSKLTIEKVDLKGFERSMEPRILISYD